MGGKGHAISYNPAEIYIKLLFLPYTKYCKSEPARSVKFC
jgi:hypothetical protein